MGTAGIVDAELMPDVGSADERVEFYAPDRPDERVMLPGRAEPIHFTKGILATSDPEEIAAVRRGVERGLYYEADPATPPLPCPKCGVKLRHEQAFALHLQRHLEQEYR